MLGEIIGSIPTIAVCIIAMLGVWYAARGEIRRDVAREAQAMTMLKNAQKLEDCERLLAECEESSNELRVLLERCEKSLADALAENRTLREILSKTHSGGITVSGGTVNVHGDAVGGDEAKRDEYRPGGNVNQTKTNSGG